MNATTAGLDAFLSAGLMGAVAVAVITVLAVAHELRVHWRLAGAVQRDREAAAAVAAAHQVAELITVAPRSAIATSHGLAA